MTATHELESAVERTDDFEEDGALLTVQDTARLLSVSVTWVYEHVRPGAADCLPVVKLGKYLRFDRRDLQAYIDAKRAEVRRAPRRR